MNHLILAETQFFAMINGKDNGSTETAYGGFVQEVINLCYGGNDAKHIIVALAFAEIELQHHPQNLSASEENVVTVYIRKALSFIRKMQKMVSASAITSVPPLTSTSETKATVPALQWTGNAVELVELIYALYATGCINGGKAASEGSTYFTILKSGYQVFQSSPGRIAGTGIIVPTVYTGCFLHKSAGLINGHTNGTG